MGGFRTLKIKSKFVRPGATELDNQPFSEVLNFKLSQIGEICSEPNKKSNGKGVLYRITGYQSYVPILKTLHKNVSIQKLRNATATPIWSQLSMILKKHKGKSQQLKSGLVRPQIQPLRPQIQPLRPQIQPLGPQIQPLGPYIQPLRPQVPIE